MKKLTKDVKSEIERLYKSGEMSCNSISKKLGISITLVIKHLRSVGKDTSFSRNFANKLLFYEKAFEKNKKMKMKDLAVKLKISTITLRKWFNAVYKGKYSNYTEFRVG